MLKRLACMLQCNLSEPNGIVMFEKHCCFRLVRSFFVTLDFFWWDNLFKNKQIMALITRLKRCAMSCSYVPQPLMIGCLECDSHGSGPTFQTDTWDESRGLRERFHLACWPKRGKTVWHFRFFRHPQNKQLRSDLQQPQRKKKERSWLWLLGHSCQKIGLSPRDLATLLLCNTCINV